MTSEHVFFAVCAAILCVIHVNTDCVTPRKTIGECVLLHDCPQIVNIIKTNTLHDEITKFLQESQCGFAGSRPKVCCEKDAGPCTTLDKNGGLCVPIKKCEILMHLLEKKPFLTDNTIDILRKSECHYRGDANARVCCPIAKPKEKPLWPDVLPRIGQCGVQGFEDKIVGGSATDIYEFPWMALLEYGSGRDTVLGCGGSLINSRYVLTAAHCVTGSEVSRLGNLRRVRLGEYDINNTTDCLRKGDYNDCTDPPVIVDVESIISHHGFSFRNPNKADDIALIRLKTSVKYTDFIKPICLPPARFKVPESMTVAGWGKTETAWQSPVKLKLRLPLYDTAACKELYGNMRRKVELGPGQICAGGQQGKDSCTGDSGGPLMTAVKGGPDGHVWFQVGVVSFGPTPCGIEQPGVYTLISEYIPWMLDNIKN